MGSASMHDTWIADTLKYVSTNDERFLREARLNCPDPEIRWLLERSPEQPLPPNELKVLSNRSRDMGRPVEAEVIDILGLSPLVSLVLTQDSDRVRFGTDVGAYVLDVSRKHGFAGCIARFAYVLGKSAHMNQQYEQAVPLLMESRDSYAQLCETQADAYGPALALTLESLGNLLADVNRLPEAEHAMSQSIDLLQRLAAENPSEYSNRLAAALNNLATFLGEQRRFSDALDVLERTLRLPCDMNNLSSKATLAATLTNKARALAESGKAEAGIEAARQSVRLKRELAQQDPETYMDALPAALINLSMLAGQTGALADAVDAASEAISILSGLVGCAPQYGPHLTVAMNNLASALIEFGYAHEAKQLSQKAADLYATLGATGPAAFQSDMERFLSSLHACIEAAGRSE